MIFDAGPDEGKAFGRLVWLRDGDEFKEVELCPEEQFVVLVNYLQKAPAERSEQEVLTLVRVFRHWPGLSRLVPEELRTLLRHATLLRMRKASYVSWPEGSAAHVLTGSMGRFTFAGAGCPKQLRGLRPGCMERKAVVQYNAELAAALDAWLLSAQTGKCCPDETCSEMHTVLPGPIADAAEVPPGLDEAELLLAPHLLDAANALKFDRQSGSWSCFIAFSNLALLVFPERFVDILQGRHPRDDESESQTSSKDTCSSGASTATKRSRQAKGPPSKRSSCSSATGRVALPVSILNSVPEDVKAMLEDVPQVSFRPGQVLLREGEEPAYVLLVLSGQLYLSTSHPEGRGLTHHARAFSRQPARRWKLPAGTWLGALACTQRRPEQFLSMAAGSELRAICIPAESFRALFMKSLGKSFFDKEARKEAKLLRGEVQATPALPVVPAMDFVIPRAVRLKVCPDLRAACKPSKPPPGGFRDASKTALKKPLARRQVDAMYLQPDAVRKSMAQWWQAPPEALSKDILSLKAEEFLRALWSRVATPMQVEAGAVYIPEPDTLDATEKRTTASPPAGGAEGEVAMSGLPDGACIPTTQPRLEPFGSDVTAKETDEVQGVATWRFPVRGPDYSEPGIPMPSAPPRRPVSRPSSARQPRIHSPPSGVLAQRRASFADSSGQRTLLLCRSGQVEPVVHKVHTPSFEIRGPRPRSARASRIGSSR
mmetsp:Transcript_24768/g.45400  ORF Transcript_24768/g.45400 Transcript_24768/m.45400 type:complete len:713 (-) Transcript_24768:31-2169(-)